MPDWWIDEEVPTGPRFPQLTTLSFSEVVTCDRTYFRDSKEEGWDIILDSHLESEDIAIGASVYIDTSWRGNVKAVYDLEMNMVTPHGEERRLLTRLYTVVSKIDSPKPVRPRFV